jgi:hypothetical protein
MLNDGILRGGLKFPDVLEPRLRNAPLAFVVGQLRRRGAAAVRVDEDQVVQESARVNLAERFLRGVIGELPERPGSFQAVVMLLARRHFPAGSLVQIFEVEPAAPRCLAHPKWQRLKLKVDERL